MAKLMTRHWFSAIRRVDGEDWHFTGNVYKTKEEATTAARAYKHKFGGRARVFKVARGYVIFARY